MALGAHMRPYSYMYCAPHRDGVLHVRLVKVLWQHRGVEEATWEPEDTMRAIYLFLFEDEGALSNIESLILELE